jgi:hypothetical protein
LALSVQIINPSKYFFQIIYLDLHIGRLHAIVPNTAKTITRSWTWMRQSYTKG